MKATLDAASLRDLAEWCARIAPAKPPTPILGAVLLDVTADGISATVTDYETWGRAELAATSDTVTRLAVSARALASIAASAAEPGNARLELVCEDDSKLRLTCRGLKASLPLMPVEDFPAWPTHQAPPGQLRAVGGASLARVLDTAAAISHRAEDGRPIVAKVRLESSPDALRVVATDTYSLHICDLPWSEPADLRWHSVIHLPPAGARAVAFMAKAAERVLLGFPEDGGAHNALTVGTAGRTLLCRLADGGGFPARYESLAPTTGRPVTVDRAELLALVKRVSTLSAVQGDKARHLEATISAGTLTLRAVGDDDASLSDDLSVEHGPEWDRGEPWTIRINAAFLAETVGVVSAKRVTLTIPGPAKAVLAEPADGETPDYPARSVLMTIRVK